MHLAMEGKKQISMLHFSLPYAETFLAKLLKGANMVILK